MEQQVLFSVAPMNEKPMFGNYEINDKKRLPLLLSLLGASILLHIVVLSGVIFVPAIRDAFYLAELFSDARNTKIVSKDYKKTEIGDDYTVTMIDPNLLFKYPEGYFSTLDPNDPNNIAKVQNPYDTSNLPVDLGGFTPYSSPNPLPASTPYSYNPTLPSSLPPPRNYTPKFTPKTPRSSTSVLPKLAKGNSPYAKAPTSDEDKDGNGIPDKFEKNTATKKDVKNPTVPNPTETAKNDGKDANSKPTEKVENPATTTPEFNKKPFEDLGREVNEKIKNNQLDLNQTAKIELSGELSESGKLIQRKDTNGNLAKLFRTNGGGDEKLIEAISKAIAALDESGFLINLKELTKGAKKNAKLKFIIEKNQKDVIIQVISDVEGKVSPESISSNLNIAIGLAKTFRQGKVEGNLLEKATVEAVGKTVVINWQMPVGDAMKLLNEQLTAVAKQPISENSESNDTKNTAKNK